MIEPVKGTLFVFTGPSGAGKGTIVSAFRKSHPHVLYSISATTRAPRPGEENGRHYYFVSREQFEEMIRNNSFLEHARYVDNYYGTPVEPVERALAAGNNIILEIDVQGALTVKQKMPEAIMVFVIPPEFFLLEQRLRSRGTETEEKIHKRLAAAREEYAQAKNFDYVILNAEVEKAVAELAAIVVAEGCRLEKRKQYLEV